MIAARMASANDSPPWIHAEGATDGDAPARQGTAPGKVLIVEDEAVIALELADRLRSFGFEVIGTAASAEQALALADGSEPDLLMMDLHIKGPIDGIETARLLRERKAVPVIFLTAYGDPATVARAMQVAPYGYLIKPYRVDELRATITAALHKHGEEMDLRRHRDHLEGLVAERTADIETLSYSMQHDLRAPARAVQGLARMAIYDEGGGLSAAARARLERIASTGVAMGRMVDGLIELARVGRGELRREPLDLAALARPIWAEIAARTPRRRVRFEAAEVPAAIADAGLAHRLLRELLGNAHKFTRDASAACVEFGCAGGGPAPEYFVRDNGAGFDMAYAQRLFHPFERPHPEADFEGTAIGLAIARRIVERHGGTIRAEAAPGAGATFRFTLG